MTDYRSAYITPFGSQSVYQYEWSTEKWDQLPSFPYYDCGLVIIGGALTGVGGRIGSGCTNEVFTLHQGQWVEHYPPMNTERYSPAVVHISDSNCILVIGGRVADFSWTAVVELFHVSSRRWHKLTNLPQALSFPSAIMCGDQIHVIGYDGAGYSCTLQALLPSDQPTVLQSISLEWIPLPQQPVRYSTACTLYEQLIVVGGHQGVEVDSIYQLVDEEWVEIGTMSSSRSECLVVTPSPDKMLIIGGWRGGYQPLHTVEEYVVV